jgi:hypothetical protein
MLASIVVRLPLFDHSAEISAVKRSSESEGRSIYAT